ncbi:MAG TPA: S66 peptidase family protein [Chloroflexia bacterium]|nr:S66 peptidase family protein [Chloroflexia bacterium]
MPGLDLRKPKKLSPGSRVAVVSPSWGGPGTVPNRYEMGVRELVDRFGFEVVDMPHTRADARWIWRNPQARVDDLHAAFSDPSIDAVITSIGGDDSVRLLPYIDPEIIRNNPKVFMGFSDTTTLHVFCLLAGLQTFYGPSVMAGFAENGGMFPYTEDWVRRTIMSNQAPGDIEPAPEWTCENVRWEDESRSAQRRAMQPNLGRKWLQGTTRGEGHLVGGCLEVLEMMKGTSWWPGPEVWDGAVFYWETSEDAPTPQSVGYWLRNYGMLGIFDRIVGMVVGRPDGYTPEQRNELPGVVQRIVAEEFGKPDLPIVMDLDFGHTYPQVTLPNGGRVMLDPQADRISLPDPATV